MYKTHDDAHADINFDSWGLQKYCDYEKRQVNRSVSLS